MHLALLRVELYSEYVVIPDSGDKRHAIIGRCGNDGITHGLHNIRVHEIEIGALGNARENRRTTGQARLIPAHMRHLEWVLLRIGHASGKATHAPWNDIQALVAAELL